MRKFIMLASIAALSAALPNIAAAQGRGHGNQGRGHGNAHSARPDHPGHGNARVRTNNHDRNRNGVANHHRQNRYGGAACPPGLANRTPACVPPGQARRLFREGQRVPTSYAFTSYNNIPLQYRQQFNIPQGYNYIYRDNSVYVVDARTRLVRDIINLIR